MERRLLDNDVVLKLGQYDLLDELLALTKGPGPIRILPTLRYRFRLESPAKAIKIIRDSSAVVRIKAFVANVAELEDEPSADLVALLEDTPQLDPGEVVLFATAAGDSTSLTYTGDKRAITALVSTASGKGIADRLHGRIKCLEQLVAEMILGENAAIVIEKLRGKQWDTALRLCSSTGSIPETLSALGSYYADLNSACNSLLAPFPHSG